MRRILKNILLAAGLLTGLAAIEFAATRGLVWVPL
jgi:hypothetical protein